MQAIRETQEQLERTKKDKNATLSQLRGLQSKLAERQKLIGNINQEIYEINKNIQYSAKEIAGLRQDLEVLKIKYAQSVRYAYKNRSSYNMVAFLFASSDFNEAIRRLKYLKKYRDYRKEQAAQIRLTQTKIQTKLGILNTEKSAKDQLKSAEEQQRMVILKETTEKDQVVRELKGKEKELNEDIEKNRKAARQVDNMIEKVIQREIELARKKAEEEERKRREEEQRRAAAAAATPGNVNVTTGSGTRSASGGTTTPATGTGSKPATTVTNNPVVASNLPKPSAPRSTASYISTLTPEAAALSTSFEANHGRLPWPVEKGFISLGYGTYTHPTQEKVKLENYGVDISTNQGAAVRAVFEGTVTNVVYSPVFGSVIIINHGQYFSVYRGLASASVKKDQKVQTKQNIGTVGVNEEGANILNFQIWKVGKNNQSTKLDPAGWIAR